MNIWFLLAGLIFGYIVYLDIQGNNKLKELRRYEFENRSNSGTVLFDTFEDAERHEKLKRKYSDETRRTKGVLMGIPLVFCLVIGACNLIASSAPDKPTVQKHNQHKIK